MLIFQGVALIGHLMRIPQPDLNSKPFYHQKLNGTLSQRTLPSKLLARAIRYSGQAGSVQWVRSLEISLERKQLMMLRHAHYPSRTRILGKWNYIYIIPVTHAPAQYHLINQNAWLHPQHPSLSTVHHLPAITE